MEIYDGGGEYSPLVKRNNNMGEIDNSVKNALDNTNYVLIKKAIENKNANIYYTVKDNGITLITIEHKNKQMGFDVENLPIELKTAIDKKMTYKNKKKAKDDAKSLVKNRYKIGDHLILRSKVKDGSEKIVKLFEVKKVIWSVHSIPVNILILKQLTGTYNNRSLDKNDCKRYHIKYEPGLQVYSMMLNFSKIRKNNQKMIELS